MFAWHGEADGENAGRFPLRSEVDGVSGLNGVRHLKLLLQKLHVTAGQKHLD